MASIAIDGPAGAGKSTIAKLVAKHLSFIYVDTGAMYRAIALYLLRNQIDIEEEEALKKACDSLQIDICYENDLQQVLLNQENVTSFLREEAVGNMASVASAKPAVRAALLELQRKLARENNVVMDGRDIGTNVLPDATCKIYLTASSGERAKRRYQELIAGGKEADIKKIKADIIERDNRDMNREIAPLKQAEDAVYLDCSKLAIEEVVGAVIKAYEERK